MEWIALRRASEAWIDAHMATARALMSEDDPEVYLRAENHASDQVREALGAYILRVIKDAKVTK